MKSFFVAALIFFLVFLGLQFLLMPKYMDGVYEGALVAEYYKEELPHDIIFIGDCEIYENISPITLWEEYGITSYMRGGPQQLIWQSYYLLEDTLRYEKPSMVVFNILAMQYNSPQKEAYNRLNLDEMRWSLSKVKAINASMKEGETFISYLFPILRYHDRWSQLTKSDFNYFMERKKVSVNGFMIRADVRPVDFIPETQILVDYRFGKNAWYYLEKLTSLCKENNIELVLIKAPTIYPFWHSKWDEQIAVYATENNLSYLNLLELAGEIGIDFKLDTYDGGLHSNVYGAEKTARYLGEFFVNNFDFKNHQNDAFIKTAWDKKSDIYADIKAAQEKEFKQYGKILTFTY